MRHSARYLIGSLAIGAVALAGGGAALGAGSPSVSFTSPTAGMSASSTVTAKVKVTNFRIDAKAVGMKPVQGEGHLHFSLDKGKFDHPKYSGANGKLAVQLGVDGKYSPSVTPGITYKGLPAGKHTLVVYLANNNHTNVGPKATVSFTVK